MPKSEALQELTKALIARGRILEAGWLSYRIVVMPRECSEVQIEETRRAFYAGCNHLFTSIMTSLDPGTEETPDDIKRFEYIQKELEEYLAEFTKRFGGQRQG